MSPSPCPAALGELLPNLLPNPDIFTAKGQDVRRRRQGKKNAKLSQEALSLPLPAGLVPVMDSECEADELEGQAEIQPELQDEVPSREKTAAVFEEDGLTTVFITHIPHNYKPEEFLCQVLLNAFEEGQFDFLYMPMNFETKKNRGYAFLNFVTPELAKQFVLSFVFKRLKKGKVPKIEVQPAAIQGRDANMEHHCKRETLRISNSWFKPMLFGEQHK
mmetsp:Transcript_28487/g.51513  ORF Transcript_28487/g.51513 Transcript_28487/m.51513 type:complete len:218 (-) Transcript_28487:45-698(-)|eukprot:CAMPEP_0197663736 /NCGR_PEP_ID=MMETSP1338-20131121/58209_1 /TAXON_ID=43686 ORGANISM="Pelagodinium beii, Strain RCC1491" /NCGR_SAMPLE_ID=MMETSP1338 /ASSEMBLY_ACC=CAM_ASM_000754 /LENGTH=217 /DNA_ID=CAMNT_0043242225 /DNA_START=57 /DNA_END=710 /DNA_ORIENTATION=+